MSVQRVPNHEYLRLYLATHGQEAYERVLLPHESQAVDEAVKKQREAFDEVIEQKIEVTGGDDWHDGAFRATDNEAKIIGQQMTAIRPYIGAPVIDYPEPHETRVTIGSRVAINQNGYTFPIDIIGFRAGYPLDVVSDDFEDEVTGMSPESPLARLIMGQEIGFAGTFESDHREMLVKVEGIDQTAIRDYFMHDVQIIQITE